MIDLGECPICKQRIAGIIEPITAVATGGGFHGHFWCVYMYPNVPKVKIVVSADDWKLINQWGSERVMYFTPEA